MKIEYPVAFKKVLRNMGPGFGSAAKNKQEFVQYALIDVDQVDASSIRPFLDELLQTHNPKQLKEWWWLTPASSYFFDGKELVEFLLEMKAVLSAPPYVPTKTEL